MARLIVNFLLFQFGWFASVLGAARQTPWLGVVAVVLVVAIHLVTRATAKESILVAAAAFVGLVMDSLLLHSGLVTYQSQTPLAWLAPAWIVAMWANFAITLRHSLAWLGERRALTVIMGAVLGPLAYWGAARLGAAELSGPVPALAALALVWGSALPALFWMSERLATSTS